MTTEHVAAKRPTGETSGAPWLSIIVPVFNESAIIESRLSELVAAMPGETEIIVVDGGSTDGTDTLLQRFAIRALRAPLGRARQMNAGADCAKGTWLLFLHADTQLTPGALRALGAALQVESRWGRFDIELSGQRRVFRLVERMINWRSRWTHIATGDQGIFVRKDLFDEVGGYPDVPLMEDVSLSRVLRNRSRPLCLTQRLITSSRRWEEHGTWRTIVTMWLLRAAYFGGVSPHRLARIYYPNYSF